VLKGFFISSTSAFLVFDDNSFVFYTYYFKNIFQNFDNIKLIDYICGEIKLNRSMTFFSHAPIVYKESGATRKSNVE